MLDCGVLLGLQNLIHLLLKNYHFHAKNHLRPFPQVTTTICPLTLLPFSFFFYSVCYLCFFIIYHHTVTIIDGGQHVKTKTFLHKVFLFSPLLYFHYPPKFRQPACLPRCLCCGSSLPPHLPTQTRLLPPPPLPPLRLPPSNPEPSEPSGPFKPDRRSRQF